MSKILAYVSRHTETKHTSNENEFRICCRSCSDSGFHLYVNSRTGKWFCHRCGSKGPLRALVQAITGMTDFKEIQQAMKLMPKEPTVSMETLSEQSILEVVQGWGVSPKAEHHKRILMPDWARIPATMSRIALAYLKSRGFSRETIMHYDVRVDKLAKYIVVPFYEFGELVYWQAREIGGDRKANPPKGDALGKSEYLFNHDGARRYSTVVVVEGWADAMTVGKNAVAIQGKILSEVQAKKLVDMEKPREFVVFLDADDDTAKYQLRAAKLIAKLTTRPVFFVDAPGSGCTGDPNEIGSKRCVELISTHKVDARNTAAQTVTLKNSLLWIK